MLFRGGAEIDTIAMPAAIVESAVTSFQNDLSKGREGRVDNVGHAR
jgi:hypothetical protein